MCVFVINVTGLSSKCLVSMSDFGLFLPCFGVQCLNLVFTTSVVLFPMIWFVMPWFKLIESEFPFYIFF